MARTSLTRNVLIVRQWRILLALRRRPMTLNELAREFGVSQRTIRRDMWALCEVPFPIVTSADDPGAEYFNPTWSLMPMTEWPRNERVPKAEIQWKPLRHGGRTNAAAS